MTPNQEHYLKYKETYKTYYQNNKEAVISRVKEYYQAHRKDKIAYQLNYNKKYLTTQNKKKAAEKKHNKYEAEIEIKKQNLIEQLKNQEIN